MTITKDMLVTEIIEKDPDTAEILSAARYALHRLYGCKRREP